MHHYWGFGLNIASEIEFPEFLPYRFNGEPDVLIKAGQTPQVIDGVQVVRRVNVNIAPDAYLLKLPKVASYYVSNGNSIVVEPVPGADAKSVRLFLLSNAMAAILHQRNLILLHASAIVLNGGVMLFCGASGAGKSTTVSKLRQRGYQLFSDDVCVLKPADGGANTIDAVPSYPMLKLWDDSFTKLNIEPATEADRIRPQLPKYSTFFHQDFDIEAKPIKKIFLLEKEEKIQGVQIKKLTGLTAFEMLEKNTYRHAQMSAMGKFNVQFGIISKLTATTPTYIIKRENNANTLHELTDLLIAHF